MNTIQSIHIECTNNCNLRCAHCYTDAKPKSSEELPLYKICEVVRDLMPLGLVSASLSGGEPMLYEDIFKLINYCKRQGLSVTLNTNGTIRSNALLSRVIHSQPDMVVVSLHGSQSNIHGMLTRNETSFFEAIKTIEDLRGANIPVATSVTVNKQNLRDLGNLVALNAALGVENMFIFRFLAIGRGVGSYSEFDITPEEHSEACSVVVSAAKSIGFDIKHIAESPYHFWGSGEVIHHSCDAGKRYCVIAANGDVYACTGLRADKLVCGNVHTKSINDIWRNSSVIKNLRKISNQPSSALLGICKSCAHLSVCRGGCRASAYTANHNIFASDPTCWHTYRLASNKKEKQNV